MRHSTALTIASLLLCTLGVGISFRLQGTPEESRNDPLAAPDKRVTETGLPQSEARQPSAAPLESAQNRRLLQKVAQLEERIAQLATRQAGQTVGQDRAAYEPPSLTPEERMERNRTRIRRIDKALESEPQGGQWSMNTSRVLEDLFASVVPPGSSLSQTTCGETFCRLIVKHESRNARDEFERFPGKVPGMGVRGLIEENEDGTGQTTLYVVRKEYDTPEHPVRVQDSTG